MKRRHHYAARARAIGHMIGGGTMKETAFDAVAGGGAQLVGNWANAQFGLAQRAWWAQPAVMIAAGHFMKRTHWGRHLGSAFVGAGGAILVQAYQMSRAQATTTGVDDGTGFVVSPGQTGFVRDATEYGGTGDAEAGDVYGYGDDSPNVSGIQDAAYG